MRVIDGDIGKSYETDCVQQEFHLIIAISDYNSIYQAQY